MKLVRNRNGEIIELDEDNPTVPDGTTLIFPMTLMDAAADSNMFVGGNIDNHRPGFRGINDKASEAADAAYAEYVRRLTDAWRKPTANNDGDVPPTPTNYADAVAQRDAAYREYVDQLTNAWRKK